MLDLSSLERLKLLRAAETAAAIKRQKLIFLCDFCAVAITRFPPLLLAVGSKSNFGRPEASPVVVAAVAVVIAVVVVVVVVVAAASILAPVSAAVGDAA